MGKPAHNIGDKLLRAGASPSDRAAITRAAESGETPDAVAHRLRLSVSVVEKFWPTISQSAPDALFSHTPKASNRRKRTPK